ncbi:DUF4129 domain-containing protein [Micromonospora sp. WMMD998]|uniref:DUF4129 domain-containing protein n=1 Tax=Micromonospora sp. WMMD998 TaxID=3016092 RepID=UPI00249B80CD|nr:DUF4129 domain-containing protein [Micromonospora sp. WMMD998]WFE38476.1 DUF4129 domain-containing protein [Micromonospora sp. WMMD998]
MDFGVLRRWWPVAAVAALLAVAALAAGHSAIGASRIPPAVPYAPKYPSPEAVPSIRIEPREVGEPSSGGVPDWLGTVAVALLSVIVLAGVGYALWSILRALPRRKTRAVAARRTRRTAEGTAREVVAALDAGLVELDDRSTDPRTAVIACWVRLEEAAEDAGVPRQTGDTPTDLVSRLLRGDPAAGIPAIASADVLDGFAHVYREARYATHAVDERMRDQARAALRRLRGELTSVAGPV